MPDRLAPLPIDWSSVLAIACQSDGRPPGEGWQTVDEIARQTGGSEANVRRKLRLAVEAGAVECVQGRAPSGPSGVLRAVNWYRVRR